VSPATRLPLHPRPLSHEALSSWIDRLAEAYGMEADHFLRSAFPIDPPPDYAELDGSGTRGLAAMMAVRTGVAVRRVRAMTLAGYAPGLVGTAKPSQDAFEAYACRFGWFAQPAHRSAAKPEIADNWLPWRVDSLFDPMPQGCPRCLRADVTPFTRLHWRLGWMASCPRHGEMLVPLMVQTQSLETLWEQRPKRVHPDLLALDKITLGAVMSGQARLPRGVVLPGGVWLRALRALLDELECPASLFDEWAQREITAARLEGYRNFGRRSDEENGDDLWLRRIWQTSGSSPRSNRFRKTFELLKHNRRLMLLTVAGIAVQRSAIHPPPYLPGMAIHANVTKHGSRGVYRA